MTARSVNSGTSYRPVSCCVRQPFQTHAPARPTLTSTGSTNALSAKVLIFAGMVALNISVCRWLLKKDRMSRICASNSSTNSNQHSQQAAGG